MNTTTSNGTAERNIPISQLKKWDYVYVLYIPDFSEGKDRPFESLINDFPNLVDVMKEHPLEIENTLMRFTSIAKARVIRNEPYPYDNEMNFIEVELIKTPQTQSECGIMELLECYQDKDGIAVNAILEYNRGMGHAYVQCSKVMNMKVPVYGYYRAYKILASSKEVLLQTIRDTEKRLYEVINVEIHDKHNLAMSAVKRYARNMTHIVMSM